MVVWYTATFTLLLWSVVLFDALVFFFRSTTEVDNRYDPYSVGEKLFSPGKRISCYINEKYLISILLGTKVTGIVMNCYIVSKYIQNCFSGCEF